MMATTSAKYPRLAVAPSVSSFSIQGLHPAFFSVANSRSSKAYATEKLNPESPVPSPTTEGGENESSTLGGPQSSTNREHLEESRSPSPLITHKNPMVQSGHTLTLGQLFHSTPTNTSGHSLTKFSIEEILGRKEGKCRGSDWKPTHENSRGMDNDSEEKSNVSGTLDKFTLDGDEQLSHFSWLQCTRYKPPKLPRLKRKDGVKKRKLGRNPRVPFTQHQVKTLEEKFRRTHYLSSVDVAELSAALNLTETRVKIWFQNRRARERRDRDQTNGNTVSPPPSVASQRSTNGSASTSTNIINFPWLGPIPPKPSAVAQFSHAIHFGTSAFSPVSFAGLPAPLAATLTSPLAYPTNIHSSAVLPWVLRE
ncbi:homeobox protein Nkx-3.1 [Lingula anatina]|uniref:Homeobox protein Nkx-3.1 n=1 Tax=Lingula anatina TaxID=7574 RepID=A0A1S3J2Q7_LINAN|nr:homeobox protein Nkx-3.1 [Lingula anatina]|eukprot:XP_013404533.1 homeobox protein Nkx-3.1 [Lingula anatina]